jgi:hypothetical protein
VVSEGKSLVNSWVRREVLWLVFIDEVFQGPLFWLVFSGCEAVRRRLASFSITLVRLGLGFEPCTFHECNVVHFSLRVTVPICGSATLNSTSSSFAPK